MPESMNPADVPHEIFLAYDAAESACWGHPDHGLRYAQCCRLAGLAAALPLYAEQVLDRQPLIGTDELSAYLGIPVQSLYQWTVKGAGPSSFKVGRWVRYRWRDIDAWLESSRDDQLSRDNSDGNEEPQPAADRD